MSQKRQQNETARLQRKSKGYLQDTIKTWHKKHHKQNTRDITYDTYNHISERTTIVIKHEK